MSSYTYQTQFCGSGQNPPYLWPSVILRIGDQNGVIVLPLSGGSPAAQGCVVQAAGVSYSLTPTIPAVQLVKSAGGQTVTLTTENTPGFPSGPGFSYQQQNVPYLFQLYAVWNNTSNSATIQADAGATVNGASSFSQPGSSVYVYAYDQVSNFTPNAATVATLKLQ